MIINVIPESISPHSLSSDVLFLVYPEYLVKSLKISLKMNEFTSANVPHHFIIL